METKFLDKEGLAYFYNEYVNSRFAKIEAWMKQMDEIWKPDVEFRLNNIDGGTNFSNVEGGK